MKKFTVLLSLLTCSLSLIAANCDDSHGDHGAHHHPDKGFRITKITPLHHNKVRLDWDNAPQQKGVLYVLTAYDLNTKPSEWFTAAIIINPKDDSFVIPTEPGTKQQFFRLKFTPSR